MNSKTKPPLIRAKRFPICLFLCLMPLLIGCGREIGPKQPPIYGLVIPAGNEQWKKEIKDGFQFAAREFHVNYIIREYEETNPSSIISAALSIPKTERTPICIVFLRREPIASVASALSKNNRVMITVGVDDASAERVGHIGMSPERLAYLWKIRATQLFPRFRNVLFVFGREPIKTDRIEGAVFQRSRNWREFKTRFRESEELSKEDVAWADVVVCIGLDALNKARLFEAKAIFPVDSDDNTLQLIESEELPFALAPKYFEIGVRALRLAREHHIRNFIAQPLSLLDYAEIDQPSLKLFRARRYKVTPGILLPESEKTKKVEPLD
ncbi:MAG TPA: hypothetical protein VNK96_06815 [Fimbriimonadales bacterium]|nr:hypothetical protein [Fimbriimonadales bacterium]